MKYKLTFDMERIDKAIEDQTNTIFAEKSNLHEIEYVGTKKGFFRNIIYTNDGNLIEDWPKVEFYYSSRASQIENEYLLNSVGWPIVNEKVKKAFEKEGIIGIQYLPISLIDVSKSNVNNNYFVLNITNVIDAYDMELSEYIYNEKFNVYTFLPHNTVLDNKVCSEYDIFRCKQNIVPIYVSDKIKNIIEENLWIGFELYPQKSN